MSEAEVTVLELLSSGVGVEGTLRKVMLNERERMRYKERLKRIEKGRMRRKGKMMIEKRGL